MRTRLRPGRSALWKVFGSLRRGGLRDRRHRSYWASCAARPERRPRCWHRRSGKRFCWRRDGRSRSAGRRSRKALDLFTNETTREEFRKLYPVIVDIVTFPEFIESEFSRGEVSKGKKLGKLRAAKAL